MGKSSASWTIVRRCGPASRTGVSGQLVQIDRCGVAEHDLAGTRAEDVGGQPIAEPLPPVDPGLPRLDAARTPNPPAGLRRRTREWLRGGARASCRRDRSSRDWR